MPHAVGSRSRKPDSTPRCGSGWVWLAAGLLLTSVAPVAAEEIASTPLAAPSGPRGSTMFTVLDPALTGISTRNDFADPAMWAEHYQELAYGAMGTGVAIGDYDNDGRPDVFVVSKTETSRLFRNLGSWKFEDVTTKAGLAADSGGWARLQAWLGMGRDLGDTPAVWKQGAVFADVNNDGWLDLYVCRFNAPNWLFINQGDGAFVEEAAARGLALVDGSSSGAFCDYDRDGWLDVYVQTNMSNVATHPHGRRDFLLRNRGDGTFEDVTDRAGIAGETSGHSATWWDYDEDGWPDLYVANDFAVPDALYRNNRDGTFTHSLTQVAPHTPYYAMGADQGDVNNDGHIDLLVADMAPSSHERDQRGMASSRARAQTYDEHTPAPQYMRNALYLGTGMSRVLEAAHLAGIAATDWTWSVRFEDLDNDGLLDLHVTNGMIREYHNVDLLARLMGVEDLAQPRLMVRASPVMNEANFAFRNRGDLQFEDVSAAWGLNQHSVSFGAAFGDLDGDGDLDVVFANYEAGVTVARNDSTEGHRVIVALRGTVSNRFGIGATVRLRTASGEQVRPIVVARGYLSSSEPVAHFGLGGDERIERLTIAWPNGRQQILQDLAVDRRYTITELGASAPVAGVVDPGPASTRPATVTPLFTVAPLPPAAARVDLGPAFSGNDAQPLLPFRLDGQRPMVASADVSGLELPANTGAAVAADFDHDGRPDVFVGARILPGSYPLPPRSALWANRDGKYVDVTDEIAPGLREVGMVTAAVWSDVDADGWIDLVVALDWGGVRFWRNHGGRRFEDRSEAAGFAAAGSGWWSALAAADFNGDGRVDLAAGNVGLNTPYQATRDRPVLLYYGEFKGGGESQLIEAFYAGDRIVPRRTRNDLGAVIPSVLRRFPRNDDYARASLDDILGAERVARARRFAATELRSGVFLSRPDGTYRFEPWPRIMQIAPVVALVAEDFDGDGHRDIAALQNSHAPIPLVGRFDGGIGQLLRGDGAGGFAPVAPELSGLVVPGEGQSLEARDLDGDGGVDLVARMRGSATIILRNHGARAIVP